MANVIHLKALAKINLGLDVTGVREDGYHMVRMIMQTIDLFDWVTIRKSKQEAITLRTNLNFLPTDEHNIAYQAALLLKQDHPQIGGLELNIHKCIPVAAGMAGGSTDAAAVLYGLNKLFGLGLSLSKLMEYGLKLGADVPYCLLRGTALAEGIGEKLTRLAPMPDCHILIAKPPVSVSTKLVYQSLDALEQPPHPPIDAQIRDLEEQDLCSLAGHMGNVLESVTVPMHPEIERIKEMMMEQGAIAAMMSGSGPTVFGIFSEEGRAYEAKARIRSSGIARQVYVTKPYNIKEKNR
ncbi:MAG: 4-(cytidine 5'-diphospho)-2-C-methyl-D-erythritol kinase [bacterium]|nr:4-(cytidine 5'-diphospho)-2-C-methyl-D-erythritol kinase [bacterium]MDY4101146.1 4-(cytidine 5'-diphospho)-2-C-methyl-D-erythritol kinase [Lachnospiraceae bacterium]